MKLCLIIIGSLFQKLNLMESIVSKNMFKKRSSIIANLGKSALFTKLTETLDF